MATTLIEAKNHALYEAMRKLEHVRTVGFILQELPETKKMSIPCAFDLNESIGALLFDLGSDGAAMASSALDMDSENEIRPS